MANCELRVFTGDDGFDISERMFELHGVCSSKESEKIASLYLDSSSNVFYSPLLPPTTFRTSSLRATIDGSEETDAKRRMENPPGVIKDLMRWDKRDVTVFYQLYAGFLRKMDIDGNPGGRILYAQQNKIVDDPELRGLETEELPFALNRIIALAYYVTYILSPNRRGRRAYSDLKDEELELNLFIDEIENGLHPNIQADIVPAIVDTLTELFPAVQFSFHFSTNSPIVMHSLEPIFDPARDFWFDINGGDEEGDNNREFKKFGSVIAWLTEGFGFGKEAKEEGEEDTTPDLNK